MNFLQYCAAPKKLLTSIANLGLGQFIMTATLEGSIFNSPPLLYVPNNSKMFCQIHILRV